MKKIYRLLTGVLVLALLCTAFVSCGKPVENDDVWENAVYTENKEFGNGSKKLEIEVKAEDKSVVFTINTDKKTVGDALLEHSLISGEEGPYGLYVKKVNGITADYDINQCYWSFNKDGEYMQTGVDETEFSDGDHFELVYTKQE